MPSGIGRPSDRRRRLSSRERSLWPVRRQVAINFASTYPADDPNGLLANLNGKTSLGFDSAEYRGLNFGPTQIDVQVENGQMQILPFSTTVNNGKLNFAAEATSRRRRSC